jgi:hypothetical protein
MSKIYKMEDFAARFENLTNMARLEVEFTSNLTGGQPATRDGITEYVIHHLAKTNAGLRRENPKWTKGARKEKRYFLTDEGESAVARIVNEEVGTEDVAPDTGELEDEKTYAVNVLRWTNGSPWLGDWQIKACIKQAASRLGYFVKKKGSKGDLAEGGRVLPVDASERGSDHRVHLIHPEGPDGWERREWNRIFGRVQTPSGGQSIVTDAEVAPIGTRLFFEYRWARGKIGEEEILNTFTLAQNCGFGSAKSLERGRFKILQMEVDIR